MFCKKCGHEIENAETPCPYCGNANQESIPQVIYEPRPEAPAEKKGTVLGVLSLVLAFLVPIAGVVLGIIAIVQGRKTQNTAAWVMGIIGIILAVIMIVINFISLLAIIGFIVEQGVEQGAFEINM